MFPRRIGFCRAGTLNAENFSPDGLFAALAARNAEGEGAQACKQSES